MQCSTLQINMNVKCITNINTHKMTTWDPNSMLLWFWVQFRTKALQHHKHWFCSNDLSRLYENSQLLSHKFRLYGQFDMVSTSLKNRYHVWKGLGFSLTLNIGITLKIYLEVKFLIQEIARCLFFTNIILLGL
jgi:hypothetical protein